MKILYLPNSYSQQRQREKKANIYPVRMAMEAEWYRKQGHEVDWIYGKSPTLYLNYYNKTITEPENLPFLSLPHPDRVFTRAKEYTSGNYKYLPGTHILSASGCPWGRCSFCVEQGQPYEIRSVEDIISEIEECKALGFKEVFDDSATFPLGKWLDEFTSKFRRFNNRVSFSCNMRIGKQLDFFTLHNVGFRMLLFGIESANQITLDKINKGVKVEDIIPTIKKASEAGLDCHIACMVAYPWETLEENMNTINLVKYLLIKGYANTAQCSFYTPPIGQEQGNEKYRYLTNKIYDVAFNPLFWYNKIVDIKSMADFKYLIRGIKEGINAKTNCFSKAKV